MLGLCEEKPWPEKPKKVLGFDLAPISQFFGKKHPVDIVFFALRA